MSIFAHDAGLVNPADLDRLNADMAFFAYIDRDREALDRLAADLMAEAVRAAERDDLESWLDRLDAIEESLRDECARKP